MILRRLITLLVVALVASACGRATDSVAATVNGTDILVSEVLALRDSYGDDAVLANDFRDDLTRLIFQEIVAQGLADDFEYTVDPSAVQARIDEFNAALADSGITRGDALGIPGATEELLYREAVAFELRTGGIAQLAASGDIVRSIVEDEPELITEVCVRHILVDSRAAAEDVAQRLAGGEDFGAVASEVSLDSVPGGDLGCSTAARYVPQFAQASLTAPVGTLFGPVETEFGFHVLIVDDRTAPTLAEVQADPSRYLPSDVAGSLWVDWFNSEVRAADISIASEIGNWNATASGITPPSGG